MKKQLKVSFRSSNLLFGELSRELQREFSLKLLEKPVMGKKLAIFQCAIVIPIIIEKKCS